MPEVPAGTMAPPDHDAEQDPAPELLAEWNPMCTFLVAAIAVVAIARLWIPPVRSSLWLDETGTVWLLQGSFLESVGHALDYQGGSPLFYVLLWPVRALLGGSELALRLPSLVGMGLAALLLYRLGRRLFDAGTGLIAAALFVALPAIAFAAVDARPYALAMASMVGSTLLLVRWLDEGKTRDGVLYAATFAATIYLHYLFALPLLAHGIYLLFRLGRATPVSGKRIGTVYAVTAAILVPAVPILLRVASERGILSNPFPQTPGQIFSTLLPPTLAWALVGGFALACLFWPPRVTRWDAENGAVPFVVAWFVVPFVTLVILSEATSTDLMVPRYFLSAAPALALGIAVAIRRLGNSLPQAALVGLFAVYATTRFFSATHTTEDWRAAAALEREIVTDEATPTLLFSGFIEGAQASWLRDKEKSSYLNAPAAAYSYDGTPIYPLPFGLNEGAAVYMEEVARDMEDKSKFVLVTRGADSHNVWLSDRLGPEGFVATERGSFGGQIRVFEFTRSEDP